MRAASQPQLCTHREGTRLIPVHGPTHRHMLTHKTRAACRRLRCSCLRNAGVQQPARNFAIASSLCMRRPRGQARMVPPAMHSGRSARAAARRSDAISERLPQPPRMCCARWCTQPPAVLCGLIAFCADPTFRPPGRPASCRRRARPAAQTLRPRTHAHLRRPSSERVVISAAVMATLPTRRHRRAAAAVAPACTGAGAALAVDCSVQPDDAAAQHVCS